MILHGPIRFRRHSRWGSNGKMTKMLTHLLYSIIYLTLSRKQRHTQSHGEWKRQATGKALSLSVRLCSSSWLSPLQMKLQYKLTFILPCSLRSDCLRDIGVEIQSIYDAIYMNVVHIYCRLNIKVSTKQAEYINFVQIIATIISLLLSLPPSPLWRLHSSALSASFSVGSLLRYTAEEKIIASTSFNTRKLRLSENV